MGRVLTALLFLALCVSSVVLAACGCTAGQADTFDGGPGGTSGTGGTGGTTTQSRAMLVCQNLAQQTCDAFVRCHAEASAGVLITPAMCTQTVPSATRDCEASNGAAIQSMADSAFTACSNALAALPCSSLCNRVPADPPECVGVPGYDPTTTTVTCTP